MGYPAGIQLSDCPLHALNSESRLTSREAACFSFEAQYSIWSYSISFEFELIQLNRMLFFKVRFKKTCEISSWSKQVSLRNIQKIIFWHIDFEQTC